MPLGLSAWRGNGKEKTPHKEKGGLLVLAVSRDYKNSSNIGPVGLDRRHFPQSLGGGEGGK